MKTRFSLALTALLFLGLCAGCAPAEVSPSPGSTATLTPAEVPPTASPRVTRTPAPTRRSAATSTPTAPAEEFNAARVVTSTPASPAQCPREKPDLVPSFVIPIPTDFVYDSPDAKDAILQFLNEGGSLNVLIDYLINEHRYPPDRFVEMDLTNDGVIDLLVYDGYVRVYSCKDYEYYPALDIPWNFSFILHVPSIEDMNLDGVPEILISRSDKVSVGVPFYYQILSWNGRQFQNLIAIPDLDPDCYDDPYTLSCIYGGSVESWGWSGTFNSPVMVQDVDHNGTQELVIRDGIPHGNNDLYFGPWRAITRIFMWDGTEFSLYQRYPDPPKYRFEALQDADGAALEGEYSDALDLYQQVIFSDELDWWSEERQAYEYYHDVYADPDITPPAVPTPDPDEHYSLAAYARYRIMLLHVLNGDLQSAQVAYDTLQEKFPLGQVGHIHVELASVFWNEFQATQNVGKSCDRVIEFAANYDSDVFRFIGDRYYVWQSKIYVPQDICPFR